jgi:iron-sulfur cluster repair protein YtfE (RIC family)
MTAGVVPLATRVYFWAVRVGFFSRGRHVFGRPTMTTKFREAEVFENIQREHEELRENIAHIHQLLAAHNTPGDELATQLHHLHTALVEHFWHEEHKGFFDEVVAQAPQLTRQAHKLCAEHQEMLHTASELARFAAAGAGSETWWRELSSRFHVFGKQLMHHEGEENSLLQQAYQDDVGTHD